MIVITGGAGFIGSALAWELNRRGRTDIIVVDRLSNDGKWKNLTGISFDTYMDRDEFITELEAGAFGSALDAILHLGACSSTSETDEMFLMENNYRYTLRIGEWWERHPETRFIYASSASTYGDGRQGYGDDENALDGLRPLNMYGYSKHLFDLHAKRRGWLNRITGLKYFNVFGPNEYHKGDMRSLVCKAWKSVNDTGQFTLFRSERPEFADGEQARDFIYVKDAVAITLFFMDHPDVCGVYNVGTGIARTWNDLGRALFSALDLPPSISYVPMPAEYSVIYQYFTQAETAKLLAAGCSHRCVELEEAVDEYVNDYLIPGRYIDDPQNSR